MAELEERFEEEDLIFDLGEDNDIPFDVDNNTATTSSDANTLTYSTTNVSSLLNANYAKSGNGAARITFLSTSNLDLSNLVVSISRIIIFSR